MELSEIYQVHNGVYKPKISFEIFPPQDGNISSLFDELRFLKKYNPVLISLTYSPDGKTRDLSFELLRMILDLELNPMPHLTCVCSTKELIEHYLIQIENMGIENVLALRGNRTKNINDCSLDFAYASDLVEFIHQKTTLSIGVAGYPEIHAECNDVIQDIENMKKKVDAGASVIYTQLFFENDKFYSYIDKLKNSNINIPVIAGILPIIDATQVEKMVQGSNVKVPKNLLEKLKKYPADANRIGLEYTIMQCKDLIANGVEGIHLYTLNKSEQVSKLLDNIL